MVFCLRLLSHFSLLALHRLGGLLGKGVYLVSPTYRRHLRENLVQAMGPKASAQVWRVAAESGKQALELPFIWLSPLEKVCGHVRDVQGWAHLQAAHAAGHGVILFTPHIGCFEIVGPYVAQTLPLTCLFRPPKNPTLAALLRQGRERGKMRLAPADVSGVRLLVKALRMGEAVALLPDQAPKTGEGVWLPFFDRPAYTMTLAARLTETRATVLLTWGERLPEGAGFRLHFSPLPEPLSGDTLARAAQINRMMEALIRTCPDQYLWGYNRYKVPAGAARPEVTPA